MGGWCELSCTCDRVFEKMFMKIMKCFNDVMLSQVLKEDKGRRRSVCAGYTDGIHSTPTVPIAMRALWDVYAYGLHSYQRVA